MSHYVVRTRTEKTCSGLSACFMVIKSLWDTYCRVLKEQHSDLCALSGPLGIRHRRILGRWYTFISMRTVTGDKLYQK